MGDGGGVVEARAGCECMGGTHGSGVLSSADDVLAMSVVRGVRGAGRVCEMCVCLARGVVGGVRMRGLCLNFTNPVATGVCGTSVCVWIAVVLGEWVVGLGQGMRGCGVCCESGFFVYMACPCIYIVLSGYLHIFGLSSVQSCCNLSISASYYVFVCGRYRRSRLACVWFSDLDYHRHRLLS